jgi:hypothetical protein
MTGGGDNIPTTLMPPTDLEVALFFIPQAISRRVDAMAKEANIIYKKIRRTWYFRAVFLLETGSNMEPLPMMAVLLLLLNSSFVIDRLIH